MAFQKTLKLRNGITGTYVRLVAWRWDRLTREASGLLALYEDATKEEPMVPLLAHVRLSGTKFDQAQAATANSSQAAQLYLAAKTEVICDLGPTVFSDAEDV
jgi:hypothetical protein